jgi:antibiotic biosynthesis monooxygenase (ABM) superfamily enzyme
MTVYLCRTYFVKPGKLKEHTEWGKRLVALMKSNPSLFDGAKSLQVLSYKRSGSARKFTAMWGFTNSANLAGWEKGLKELPEEKAIRVEFMDLIVPESMSVSVARPIKAMHKTKRQKPKKQGPSNSF